LRLSRVRSHELRHPFQWVKRDPPNRFGSIGTPKEATVNIPSADIARKKAGYHGYRKCHDPQMSYRDETIWL
jgi:hypothetical protein